MLNKGKRTNLLLVILWVLSASMLAGGTWSSQVDGYLADPRFGQFERQQVHQLFLRAESEQVPVESLILRLSEGVAKGIRFDAVYGVLSSDLDSYVATRDLIRQELGSDEADRLLGISTVWDRTVTMERQGVKTTDLAALLRMFSKQKDEERWNNYRYGGGLFLALTQWGLAKDQTLEIIEALSRSSIPGAEYRMVVDVFNEGIASRIPAEEMARRIIRFAPKSRSVAVLERMVR